MVPQRFLFMKVGSHAGESWEQILKRKRREFDRAGMMFWGYGGSVCHPIKQVQPFARASMQGGGGISLIMQPVHSTADPVIVPATEYSEDGKLWKPLPKGVQVTGSRYALVLGEIKPGDLDISLGEFEVGVGPSFGKPAEQYLKGRIDKACLVRSNHAREAPSAVKKGAFVADMKDPFAVLLR